MENAITYRTNVDDYDAMWRAAIIDRTTSMVVW